jgi:hypothetical protein
MTTENDPIGKDPEHRAHEVAGDYIAPADLPGGLRPGDYVRISYVDHNQEMSKDGGEVTAVSADPPALESGGSYGSTLRVEMPGILYRDGVPVSTVNLRGEDAVIIEFNGRP